MQFEYLALLTLTTFFLFAWLPASVAKYKSFGWKWISSNREVVLGSELLPWGARAERAHANLKDYFPVFAVAVILLGLVGNFNECTAWAAWIFVGARLGHFISYITGHVMIRFITYVVAMGANVYLLAKVVL